eukprot:TRINITY_DN21186_c0_g1_i1.p1 TRINITY_DN21186_c0_g1~~TRINITY_DN21186_c0_g1_i1.p1  ORF type:complete len:444 (+),score=107.95 TRINITY_DN21186_c0_g1_i1:112-1443(+)
MCIRDRVSTQSTGDQGAEPMLGTLGPRVARPWMRAMRRYLCSAVSSAVHQQPSTFVSRYSNLTSRQEIEDYLERSSFQHKRANEHVVVKECPFCHPIGGKIDNMWKLYILNTNGCFKCFRCQSQGSWYDFKSKIQSRKGSAFSVTPVLQSGKPASTPAAPAPIPAVLPAPGTSQEQIAHLRQSTDAMEYLTKQRKLTSETLDKYGVGLTKLNFDSGPEWCLSFPWFDGNETMVRYKARALSTKAKMRLVPKGGGWSMFGLNTTGDATEVVITEGEFDAMAVHQATGMAAISLPNGAGSLPVEVLPLLEKFTKIYLWMDHDAAGLESVPKFVKKLGMGRTSVVSGVTTDTKGKQKLYKDANDALRDGADLRAMIEAARPEPHDQILDFGMLRNELYQNLMYPDRLAGRRSNSLPKLDAILKGHRRGELTIMTCLLYTSPSPRDS